MYQALYRKYRPRRFSDVVGQSHITETLRRQIETGRISHAYLFVGTRGTGKTTCAKILSRALNCEHPVNGDPCNECPSCLGIESGSVLDVVEIDAASNNGVDNVRAIRDEAVYTPASVKKRVYIIDEVHMLSTSAFNALLKILEEPPEHLVFILATTELRKIPATILSRCQRFSFKRISPEDIRGRLEYVAGKEGLKLTDGAAELLSRLADGSMRDALSLLDQCVTSDVVDEEAVMGAVGLMGASDTAKLWQLLASGDVGGALELFQHMYDGGGDPASILSGLLSLIRDMLMSRAAPSGCGTLISGSFSQRQLADLCEGVPSQKLLSSAKALQEAGSSLSTVRDRRICAQLCLVELSGILSSGQGAQNSRPPQRTQPVVEAGPSKTERAQPQPVVKEEPAPLPPWEEEPQPQPDYLEEPPPWEDGDAPEESVPWEQYQEDPEPPEPQPEPQNQPEPASEVESAPGSWWDQVLAACRDQVEGTSYTFLSDSVNLVPELNGNTLTLRARNDFVLMMVNTPAVKSAVSQAACGVLGRNITVAAASGLPEPELREDKLDQLKKFGNIRFE